MSSAVTHAGFELEGERSHLLPLLRDIWDSRTLIRTLARKDFYVKYRRASIGVLWAVGLPFIQAAVLSLIFSKIVRFHTVPPYSVFVFAGMMPWSFFSGSINQAVTSIVDGSGIATKVYFPRAVLPVVNVLSGFHGYVPAMGVLVLFAAVMHAHFGVALLLLIPATLLMLVLTLGFSLVLAAMHVYFRDMKYIVAAITFPWLWASAVMYPLRSVGSLVRYIQYNPVVGMIELYRAAFGGWHPAGNIVPGTGKLVLISVIWAAALTLLAFPLYLRYDRVFCDLL